MTVIPQTPSKTWSTVTSLLAVSVPVLALVVVLDYAFEDGAGLLSLHMILGVILLIGVAWAGVSVSKPLHLERMIDHFWR